MNEALRAAREIAGEGAVRTTHADLRSWSVDRRLERESTRVCRNKVKC